jgi:hypothetical protein
MPESHPDTARGGKVNRARLVFRLAFAHICLPKGFQVPLRPNLLELDMIGMIGEN